MTGAGSCLSMLSLMIGSTMMDTQSPSTCIDQKAASLGDWRADVLTRMRVLIREADPDVVEQVKWVKPTNPSGVPVWEHAGIICTGEMYKACVKLTFASGADLNDAAGLFNAGLGGGTRRAIDIGRVRPSTPRRSKPWSPRPWPTTAGRKVGALTDRPWLHMASAGRHV